MNRIFKAAIFSAFVFSSQPSPVWAGDVPLFQPVPDWIIDPGKAWQIDTPGGGTLLLDRQQKVEKDKSWNYTDVAVRAVSAEQLNGLGTLALSWHPDKGDLIIHRIEIIRGDQNIDVTKSGSKFIVLRREQNLERLAISGVLTATMQIEGLKVGDTLRLTMSISFNDPVLVGNIELSQPLLAQPIKIGQGSVRVIWPVDTKLKWRVSGPAMVPQINKRGQFNELVIAQPLPKPADLPTDAPIRFTPPAFFEASSFASWADVAKIMVPLYATDGLIKPGSPLAERVAKIAATTSDPKTRAALALRMVQDDVRYLFNGQTQGNYVPQTPAETWEKRYGDCKAKTLLLVSILRSLGIEADAALVSSQLGDLLSNRLPSLLAFDHVITRATIGSQVYWLDGTGLGTRMADLADTPPFRFALPVSVQTSGLAAIPYAAPTRALTSVDTEIDATAGLALPKLYKISVTLRGPKMFELRQAQSSLEGKGLNDVIDKIVQPYFNQPTVTKRSLSFNDEDGSALITAEGITNLAWLREDDRRALAVDTIFTGFEISADRSRPAWKDMAIRTDVPNNYESHFRVKLPAGGKGFRLDNPKDITGRYAGYDMQSQSKLEGGTFQLYESWKTSLLEIPAADLAVEREKLARAKAGASEIVAPADYPPNWREKRTARAAGLTKRLEALYAAEIAQDPTEVSAYVNRAAFLDGIDDELGAIADLNKIIALQPDADTYIWRAELYELIDQKKALADIKSAQAIDPASASAVGLLTRILVKQRKFDEALAVIDEGIPLQKDRTGFLVLKTETLAKAGRGAEALELVNKANLDKPGNSALLNSGCWARAIANVELERALKDCTKAIELSEDPSGILDSRGLVYVRMKRYDDAIADLDAALRLNPGIAESMFVRGVAKSFKGASAEADTDIRDARTIKPDIETQYAAIGVKPK